MHLLELSRDDKYCTGCSERCEIKMATRFIQTEAFPSLTASVEYDISKLSQLYFAPVFYFNLCVSLPFQAQQVCRVPPAERPASEGVPQQAHPLPQERQEARKGDATAEEVQKAVQLTGTVMPLRPVVKRARAMAITDDMKKFKAFNTIRQARAVARLVGLRAKWAKEAEADDLSKPGKK